MYFRYVHMFPYVYTVRIDLATTHTRDVYTVCILRMCVQFVSVCIYGMYTYLRMCIWYVHSSCFLVRIGTYIRCVYMFHIWYVYLSPYVYTVCIHISVCVYSMYTPQFIGTYRYVYTVCIYVSYTACIHISVCVYGMHTPHLSWYVSVRIYGVYICFIYGMYTCIRMCIRYAYSSCFLVRISTYIQCVNMFWYVYTVCI